VSAAVAPAAAATPSHVGWGTALAFVAGYVDTLGFIALAGLFTSHVTGNFVLIGKEIIGPGDNVLLKLLAFPAFIAAVAAARLIALALERRRRSAVVPLLWIQCVFLLAYMTAGLAAMPIASTDQGWALAAGMLGAVAMGVQNAQARLELATLVPTTVMTGNVTQVVIDLVDIAAGRAGADAPVVTTRLKKMAPAVVGFGVGAIAGAAAWQVATFWGLLLPTVLLALLALRGR